MERIGTPHSSSATRVLLLGCGELGKEVVIELQRFGVEVIGIDRYENAPAMQVAHRSHVVNMLDSAELRAVIEQEKPHLIVPEIEAIATSTLRDMEAEGFRVIPTANAAHTTMNREAIRRLAVEELGLTASPYRFAGARNEFLDAVREIGTPCVVKPIMSSSGKGQSLVSEFGEADSAWEHAQSDARGGADRVIVEGFVDFDYEITLLTVQHLGGVTFCDPIGHRQEGGDYKESWQPQPMSETTLQESQRIANLVTSRLGGRGIFGVELFIRGSEVVFSEVSPRPHDTGLVTLASQDLSEFALHARAILDLPIPKVRQLGPSASAVISGEGVSDVIEFSGLSEALSEPDTQVRLFGKPSVRGERRLGVALARGETLEQARSKARQSALAVQVHLL